MAKHAHEFTSLWTHFGPYGDQSVHFHPCTVEGCPVVKIGRGRTCNRFDEHHDHDLDAKGLPTLAETSR